MRIEPGRYQRAGRAANEIAGHVAGRQAAAGLRPQRIDAAGIGDVHTLDGQVLQQDAGQQRQHRCLAEGHQAPGTQQEEQPDAGREVGQSAVRQPAEAVGGEGAGRAGQAEQADRGGVVGIGRAGQQEGQRRPQHAERGEQQGAQDRAGPEQRLIDEHAQDRAQQARIAQSRLALVARQHAPQHGGHGQHQQGRHPVHGAPAAQVGQHAGEGPRQQDAQQQAAHDRAHRLAALMRQGQRGGEGHQDLGDHRQHAGQRRAQHQHRDVGREGGNQQAGRGQQRHQHDQAAPFVHIAQGHQQHQPGGIAQLGGQTMPPAAALDSENCSPMVCSSGWA